MHNHYSDPQDFAPDGSITHIPLRSGPWEGLKVEIEAEVLAYLKTIGAEPPFFAVFSSSSTSSPQIRCSCRGMGGGQATVARLIMDAGPGEIVRYRDRNPLNLRRANLVKVPGKASRRDREGVRAWVETGRRRGPKNPQEKQHKEATK